MENKSKFHYGYLIVAAIYIQVLVCGGIFYSANAVFMEPVTESLGISHASFSLYLTIQSIGMAVTLIFAPKMITKLDYKACNLIGVIAGALGFVIMAFAQNVMPFYVDGFLIGFGMTFVTYLQAGTLLPRWFKKKLGVMIATAMASLGFGGMIFNPIAAALVYNTHSLLGFEESWRGAYIVLALIVAVVCILVCLFITKNDPSDKGLVRYGEHEDDDSAAAAAVGTRSGVRASVAMKSLAFVCCTLMVIMYNYCCPVISFLPSYATSTPAYANAAYLVGVIGTVATFGSIIGGFIIGAANDKIGPHSGGTVAAIFGVIGFILMIMGGHNAIMILAGAFCFGIYYQIANVQLPIVANAAFGELDYTRIYGRAAVISQWIGTIAYTIWGAVYDATGTYKTVFVCGIVLCVLTAVFNYVAVTRGKKLPVETGAVEQA